KLQSRRPINLVSLKYNEISRNIGVAMSETCAYLRSCANNGTVSRRKWDHFPELPSHSNYFMGGNEIFWKPPSHFLI
ncbi:unnamed protein product, partial [Heterotrigona itama]